jgi:hypothetical protein
VVPAPALPFMPDVVPLAEDDEVAPVPPMLLSLLVPLVELHAASANAMMPPRTMPWNF